MKIMIDGQLNSQLVDILQDYSGVIFDMDGTLLDSMSMWHTLDVQYLRQYGCEPEPDFQQIVATMTLDVAAAYMSEHYKLPRTPKQVAEEFMALVNDYYRNVLQLKPGMLELLQELKRRGILIMVATANEYDMTYAALERTGALQYIQGLVTCTMARAGKESPAVYLMACEKINKDVSECVIFEDSLFAIKTANKEGFDVIAVYDEVAKDCWNEICKITKCQVVF